MNLGCIFYAAIYGKTIICWPIVECGRVPFLVNLQEDAAKLIFQNFIMSDFSSVCRLDIQEVTRRVPVTETLPVPLDDTQMSTPTTKVYRMNPSTDLLHCFMLFFLACATSDLSLYSLCFIQTKNGKEKNTSGNRKQPKRTKVETGSLNIKDMFSKASRSRT